MQQSGDADPTVPTAPIRLSTASPLGQRLDALVRAAADVIDGAASASLVVDLHDLDDLDDGRPSPSAMVADSDPSLAALHAAERDAGDGPGIAARRSGEVVRISSTADEGPWDAFRQACRSIGVMSTASFAITVRGERQAVLTVYSPDYHAFDVEAIRSGRSIASEIGDALATVDDWSAI